MDACAQCAFLVALLCIPNKQITKIRLFWLYTLATSGFAKASLYQHSRASVYIDPVARIGSLQQNPASHYRNSARFRGGILAPYCTSLTIFQTFPAGWVSIVDKTKLNVDESSMDCHDAVIQTSCSACHLAELLAEVCNVPGGCCQCCQTSDNGILA